MMAAVSNEPSGAEGASPGEVRVVALPADHVILVRRGAGEPWHAAVALRLEGDRVIAGLACQPQVEVDCQQSGTGTAPTCLACLRAPAWREGRRDLAARAPGWAGLLDLA